MCASLYWHLLYRLSIKRKDVKMERVTQVSVTNITVSGFLRTRPLHLTRAITVMVFAPSHWDFFGKFWYFIILKIFWHLSLIAFDIFLISWLDFFALRNYLTLTHFFGIWVWCMHVYFWRGQNQSVVVFAICHWDFFSSYLIFPSWIFLHNTIFCICELFFTLILFALRIWISILL